jgi:uncharacterized membrane protein YedE/YeeE
MHPFLLAAIGGALVGLSAVLMMALNGRIAGVSGILSGTFTQPRGERLWRLLFVIGIVIGGALPVLFNPAFQAPLPEAPIVLAIIAGLVVGFGTGLGSGCTSGHGICGISRLSMRSILATLTFIASGIATVAILRLLSS